MKKIVLKLFCMLLFITTVACSNYSSSKERAIIDDFGLDTRQDDVIKLAEMRGVEEHLKIASTYEIGTFKVDNQVEKEIVFKNVRLIIPEGATEENSFITIRPLSIEELKQTPVAIPNITLGEYDSDMVGYDIKLNGSDDEKFLKDIYISIKYNEEKLPEKSYEKGANLYYYDEFDEKWTSLKREAVTKEYDFVTVTSNHFCQFYAGATSVQAQAPQSKGLNTMPQNITAVDPMAGITELAAPTANSNGSANITYPIKVPEGINGLTPSVALNYNSDSKRGNCGVGWNLKFSSIQIKTFRVGLPKHDGTDTYLLDGKELAYIKDVNFEGKTWELYRFKLEGAFWKIYRNKSTNTFRVHKPDGSKVFYGINGNTQVRSPMYRIFTWLIAYEEDKHGNQIIYEYENVWGANKYISKISYGYDKLYSVDFEWKDREAEDVRSSYISGFLIKDSKLLRKISVNFNNSLLKEYVLKRAEGAFEKRVLQQITEYAANGTTVLNQHTFEYDTDVAQKYEAQTTSFHGSIYNSYSSTSNVYVLDVNGDGCADKVAKSLELVPRNDGSNTWGHDTVVTVDLNGGNGDLRLSSRKTTHGLWKYICPLLANEKYGNTISAGAVSFLDIDNNGSLDIVYKDQTTNTAQNISSYAFSGNRFRSTRVYRGTPDTYYLNHKSGNGLVTGFADMNGDGAVDRIKKGNDNVVYVGLYKNNTFSALAQYGYADSGWPVNYINNNINYETTTEYKSSRTECDFIDINGDGLADRVVNTKGGTTRLYLNTGKGFTPDVSNSWFPAGGMYPDIVPIVHWSNCAIQDMNNDGLPDLVVKHGALYVGINTGSKFSSLKNWGQVQNDRYHYNHINVIKEYDSVEIKSKYIPYIGMYVTPTKTGASLSHVPRSYTFRYVKKIYDKQTSGYTDMNGDGAPDRYFNYKFLSKNLVGYKNVLKKMTNVKTGSVVELEYDIQKVTTSSTYHKKKNVLTKVITSNPRIDNLKLKTEIKYANGTYNIQKKMFIGYRLVTSDTKDLQNTKKILRTNDVYNFYSVWAKTDDYRAKLTSKTQSVVFQNIASNGIITETVYPREKTEYQYNSNLQFCNELGTRTDIIFYAPKNVFNYIYDDNGKELRRPLTEYIYTFTPTTGLLQQVTEISKGAVTTEDDVRTETYYANNDVYPDCISLPRVVKKFKNSDETVLSIKRNRYDSFEDSSRTSITKGIMTSEEVWDNSSSDGNRFVKTADFSYDSYGNIQTITDNNGNQTTINTVYSDNPDEYKTVVETPPVNGRAVNLTVVTDAYGRIRSKIDANGDTTTCYYNDPYGYGRLTQVDHSIANVNYTIKEFEYKIGTKYFFVQASNLNDVENSSYLKSQVIKDSIGRVIQTKVQSVVNDSPCWIISGAIDYDSMGRVVAQGKPTTTNDGSLKYISNYTASMTAEGGATKIYYDKFGRLNKKVLPSDSLGSQAQNRKTSIEKSYSQFIEDNNFVSKETLITSTGRTSSTYSYLSGLKTKIVKNEGTEDEATTIITRDLTGNQSVVGPTGITGTKKHDSLGRPQQVVTPDAGLTEYKYNSLGLLEETLVQGKTAYSDKAYTVVYDQYKRIKELVPAEDENAKIVYDYYNGYSGKYHMNKLKSVIKGDYFKLEYKYGASYGLYRIEETKSIKTKDNDNNSWKTFLTRYYYDIQGRIKHLEYPDGEIVTYSYNSGGLLVKIAGEKDDQETIYVKDIHYNKYGQRTKVVYGNDTHTTYEYTPGRQLLDKMNVAHESGLDNTYDYHFTEMGEVESIKLTSLEDISFIPSTGGTGEPFGEVTTTVENMNASQTYKYDKLGRISTAQGGYLENLGVAKNYNRTFTFDKANRMLTKEFEGGKKYIFNYSTTSPHAISFVSILDNNKTVGHIDYSHDKYGRLSSKKSFKKENGVNALQEEVSFVYNSFNEIEQIKYLTDNTGLKADIHCKYGIGNQRIIKNIIENESIAEQTVYVNGFYDLTDNRVNKHISDGKHIIASKNDDVIDNIVYYTSNNIGSTVMLTNNSGNKLNEYMYTPYGELWVSKDYSVENSSSNTLVSRLFTGQQFDKETGLYYYNARYYDPQVGSFLKPDPAMDGLNHYSYCNANPVNYVDPTGLIWVENGDGTHTPTHKDDTIGQKYRELGYDSWQEMASEHGIRGSYDEKGNWIPGSDPIVGKKFRPKNKRADRQKRMERARKRFREKYAEHFKKMKQSYKNRRQEFFWGDAPRVWNNANYSDSGIGPHRSREMLRQEIRDGEAKTQEIVDSMGKARNMKSGARDLAFGAFMFRGSIVYARKNLGAAGTLAVVGASSMGWGLTQILVGIFGNGTEFQNMEVPIMVEIYCMPGVPTGYINETKKSFNKLFGIEEDEE